MSFFFKKYYFFYLKNTNFVCGPRGHFILINYEHNNNNFNIKNYIHLKIKKIMYNQLVSLLF